MTANPPALDSIVSLVKCGAQNHSANQVDVHAQGDIIM